MSDKTLFFGLDECGFELFAVRSWNCGTSLGSNRDHMASAPTRHEEVRDPVGKVEVAGSAGFITGVVTKLKEVHDVGVPGFKIDTACAFSLSALVDRHRGIQGLEPRDNAIERPLVERM